MLGLIVNEELSIVDSLCKGPIAVPELRQVQASGGQDKARIPNCVIAVGAACIQGCALGATVGWQPASGRQRIEGGDGAQRTPSQ